MCNVHCTHVTLITKGATTTFLTFQRRRTPVPQHPAPVKQLSSYEEEDDGEDARLKQAMMISLIIMHDHMISYDHSSYELDILVFRMYKMLQLRLQKEWD